MQAALDANGIALRLIVGADAHMAPNFVGDVVNGTIPTLAESRYVLVEPPHHTAPQRLEQFFFDIVVSGYVPILTHPERLSWINHHYASIVKLAEQGVWMQVTSGSLTGAFGKNAQYWAQRMLSERLVHILATDAHEAVRRKPDLARGRDAAAKFVGEAEASHLVLTRPRGVVENVAPGSLPMPAGKAERSHVAEPSQAVAGRRSSGGWTGRLRRFFN